MITRLAWATDLHLNFASKPVQQALLRNLLAQEADALVVTGDIAEALSFDLYLERLAEGFGKPIYFVLGNHDYYRSSIAEVRDRARRLGGLLKWLPEAGVVELNPDAALIGHDGWADGRFGGYAKSDVMLSDFNFIAELSNLSKSGRRLAMEKLAEESAAHIRAVLPGALERYDRVIVATHVPPFRQATWHDGKVSDDDWLPFFSSRVAGVAIEEAVARHPDRKVTVLCGHTHGSGEVSILPNLRVITGGATYGQPAMQEWLCVPYGDQEIG